MYLKLTQSCKSTGLLCNIFKWCFSFWGLSHSGLCVALWADNGFFFYLVWGLIWLALNAMLLRVHHFSSPQLHFLTCENVIWDELVDPRNLLWWFFDVDCFPWVLWSPGLDPVPIKKTTAPCGQMLAWKSEVWVPYLAVWPCLSHSQLHHSSSEQSHGN